MNRVSAARTWVAGNSDNARVSRNRILLVISTSDTPRCRIAAMRVRGPLIEAGVDEALENICRKSGLDWRALKPRMRTSGRYHVETY